MKQAAVALPGVRFVPRRLTPTGSVHQGKECGGVQIFLDDWARFEPLHVGLTVACVLRRLYPEAWNVERYDRLLGHRATWEGVKGGRSAAELERAWQPELRRFVELRRQYLLYSEGPAD